MGYKGKPLIKCGLYFLYHCWCTLEFISVRSVDLSATNSHIAATNSHTSAYNQVDLFIKHRIKHRIILGEFITITLDV